MKKIILLLICLVIGYLVISNYNNIGDFLFQQKINKMLDKMSLDEKIGQMLMVDYRTSTYDPTVYNSDMESGIKSVQPGGFILFGENIKGYNQVSTLIKGMQSDSKIPMLISIDQEGGRVQRIKNLSDATPTIIPAMQKLGDTSNPNLAYDVGTVIGEELNAFGINMDNAPDMDIWSNPKNTVIGDRSFGTNANIVSKMGLPLARGLKNSNIIPVYKHFPGHGDTDVDSHYGLPVVNKTKSELYDLELKPFISAIKDGAEVIMVAHIALPNITGDNTPASLSKVIVNDLLRKELGFKGVVITDALDMKALTENYSTSQILINAINAGDDILLMPSFSTDTISTIKDAIKDNKISEKQIDDAVRRILALKYKAGLFDKQKLNNKSILGSTQHQAIINQISK